MIGLFLGTSSYGICSLESLAKLTHKFEAHYLTSLLGGSFEEIPQTYYDRSPLHFASNIKAALLVQQGSIDRVVPPNQAELIVDAIRKQKGVVEYQLFEGEGHGFRASQNIKAQFEKELEFYQKVLDL
jgi:dipeptidyl aminopeptidase/acylaminoacyl peptidase